MIELDASTVLLQWAVGGMLGCWYTTRHREVGLGYGWLLRGTYVLMAAAAAYIGFASASSSSAETIRDIGAVGVAIAIALGLGQSISRRKAGVSGYVGEHDRRSQRVAEMTGIERDDSGKEVGSGKEFEPLIDLLPVATGLIALIAAGVSDGGNDAVAIIRTVVGAAFLGFVSDAMLLGHWYLVQPGLPRRHVNDIVRTFLVIWPLEVIVMLIPTGMFSVFSGTVDDGWSGQLGWFWAACAITTGVLSVVTLKALQERAYSAVMAATGLMYLAILTAFGTDLVARAVLAG
ncbi:unannotated protein [freshwater metagenome]|uniref:Unannotated protein n=1 Tax=freshwater metagenome TaxID=449393 RepID=A0A6J6YTG2_9ZZZZ|nr:hypothetical protein [Actinomycetota bacterium]MSX16091.1 hypothetical protein [Actinomycetota bacterium]MSX36404.1 hypothetical protein [Actinomycetota bacterium]MSX77791.1 hypothetical protein [Actinomycetota bacterium]MSZ72285.1 hypothetical protein [Actinomycetota bacterium]